MDAVISTLGDGLRNSLLMAYEVWWALVLGFAISAIVQAWVPRERVERALCGSGRAGAAGDRPRGRVVVVLLRRDRDRALAVREGRVGGDRARLPVRLHQPRLGAGARALDPARVAVHARRVRRRLHPDRADDGAAALLRLTAARGARTAPCPRGRAGHHHHHGGAGGGRRREGTARRSRPGPMSAATSAPTG